MKRITALILVLAMLMSSMVASASITINAPLTLTRTVRDSKTDFVLDNTQDNFITVDYAIQPNDISVADIPLEYTDKEIVLVLDKSGSMAWNVAGGNSGTSRMSLAKAAAIRFMDKLKDYPNVKVSIVDYSTTADLYTYQSKNLLSLGNASELQALNTRVNSINASGGTNIGDGIRRAYNVLNNTTNAEKFMVFLSDGEPSAFSTSAMSYTEGNKGQYSYINSYGGRSTVNINSITANTFYTGAGSAPNYYVNWSSTGDLGGLALDYAFTMSSQINNAPKPVKSYFVAFSNVAAANKLEQIADEIEAYYKPAMTAEEIDEVYQDIAKEIKANVKLTDLSFEETIPTGLLYDSSTIDVTQTGNKLSATFDNIAYELNTAKTHYVATPIEFSIKYKVPKSGVYEFTQTNGKLSYTDINKQEITKGFSATTVTATREPVDNVNVSRVPGENANLITWDAYPNATGYKIYEMDGSTEVLVADESGNVTTSYKKLIDAQDGPTTTYRVEAIIPDDLSGKGSVEADTVPAILNLSASRSNDVFNIEWQPIDGATTYTVVPVIKGVPQSSITVPTTAIGGKIRYSYTLPSGLTYGVDDTIKFIVDATKLNSDVTEAETDEFLLKQLVTSTIDSADLDDFKYSETQTVNIKYVSSDNYPTGVNVYDPLLVLELDILSNSVDTPLEYSYSTVEVSVAGVPVNVTTTRNNGSAVKIFVELNDYSESGLPEDLTVDVKANFGIAYQSNNGELDPVVFAELQTILPGLKAYDIDKNIESLMGSEFVNKDNVLQIKSYIMFNNTESNTDGSLTRDDITGEVSDFIQMRDVAEIQKEF